jgi:hypothetical protein
MMDRVQKPNNPVLYTTDRTLYNLQTKEFVIPLSQYGCQVTWFFASEREREKKEQHVMSIVT